MVKRIIGAVAVAGLMAALVVVIMAPAFGQVVDKEDIVRNLTITSVSIDPQTKVVTVKGTVSCAPEVSRSARVAVEVSQDVGRLNTVSGYDQERLRGCEGRTPFTLKVRAEEGFFTPGDAKVRAFAGACIGRGEFGGCDVDRLSKEVQLSPA